MAAASPHFDSDEIARIGGVKAIVPLTVMLYNTLTPKQEQAVHALLILLLPRMKASDAPLLTPDARKAIHSWLATATDGLLIRRYPDTLRIAALKALEQVGDSTAVPYVERLARGNFLRLGNDRVRKAALECLPMLKANYSKVEASGCCFALRRRLPTRQKCCCARRLARTTRRRMNFCAWRTNRCLNPPRRPFPNKIRPFPFHKP